MPTEKNQTVISMKFKKPTSASASIFDNKLTAMATQIMNEVFPRKLLHKDHFKLLEMHTVCFSHPEPEALNLVAWFFLL